MNWICNHELDPFGYNISKLIADPNVSVVSAFWEGGASSAFAKAMARQAVLHLRKSGDQADPPFLSGCPGASFRVVRSLEKILN